MKIRTTRPGAGNKYFIRKENGGYSTCITGKPKDKDCNVLANCVGYSCAAYNEEHEFGYEKYHLNCNAENFIERAIASGLSVYQNPMPGGIMVWQKGSLSSSDGAGHVAICTEVDNIYNPTECKTSESGYGASKPFWRTTRKKGNGNWGQASTYKYRGCIAPVGYKPPVPPKPIPTLKYNIGDKVLINGRLYGNCDGGKPGRTVTNKVTTITKRIDNRTCKCPYNTTGDLGWIAESQIQPFKPVTEFNIGDTVIVTGPLYYRANDTKANGYAKGKRTKITRKLDAKSYRHPYNTTGDYGWCDASSLKKV